ncbi:hypothetical protein K1T71_011792 [Dendrolimus kikuchii]|uniref:Uncharacterized protein n=1 Tax=Dendrolimus kikuchii TaxID=765133 RepID=A0ACC1CM41_9NEOP|nr:hypothetical protein K1T71_011792 [Dendrolimus kikuchii]
MSGVNQLNIYNGDETLEFTNVLKSKWNKIHDESTVFRYKIDKIGEKMLDKYFLQLNPDRCLKRRIPELIENIMQPFDIDKFNFNKVSKEEVMFTFTSKDNDTHTILVNVSPISRYHSLLCPFVNECLPQVMTEDSLKLTLDLLFLMQDRELRIGFNSLCAFASVNHLHYHLLFEKTTLAVETADVQHIKGNLYKIDKYPVPAFCFEVQKETCNTTTREIFMLLKYFLDHSIAHNILITNKRSSGKFDKDVARVFIWVRKSTSGVKNFTAFNVAVCELSGWFPIFSEEAFNTLKPEDLEKELRKWSIDNFNDKIFDQIKTLF